MVTMKDFGKVQTYDVSDLEGKGKGVPLYNTKR